MKNIALRSGVFGVSLSILFLLGCGDSAFDIRDASTKTQAGIVGGATCGNGVHEPGEGCDDGNLINGDGCSSACTIEPGAICVRFGLRSSCEPCGNGELLYDQQCDDGNAVAGDGCSPTCTIESGWACSGTPSACHAIVCGDGIVDPPEGCDDGPDTSDFLPIRCRSDCQPARCGDGIEDNARLVGGVLVNEVCDHGEANGLPGLCNSGCTGYLDGITSSAPLSFTAAPASFVGLFFSDSLFSAMCINVDAPGLALRDDFLDVVASNHHPSTRPPKDGGKEQTQGHSMDKPRSTIR